MKPFTVSDWLTIAASIQGAPPDTPIVVFGSNGDGFDLVPWREHETAYLLKCPDRDALHLGLSSTRAWGKGKEG
jgi:hypothetical protein